MLSHMQAKGLSAGYNGEAVFRGLDLKIPEGSITTLIGSNGSGKSTILKTLCRIISPDSGAVYLDGEAIHEMPTKHVAQRLALLPQGAQAPAGITVGDLVEYGRFPYRSALSGLGEKDREIIIRRYFRNQTQTQVAISLGISQVQVSRLEKRILKEMRKKL